MKIVKLLAALLVFGVATDASAAQYKFSGDLNNRFMLYTDQAGMYSGAETISNPAATARIQNGTVGETWGEVKYRLQAEAATDDGGVRGVYAIELGAVRFGRAAAAGQTAGPSIGGIYSGDGVNIETRFAYVDFATASPKHRLTIGLMPFTVNKYLWSETAMGVQFKGQGGPLGYTLAWVRGLENYNTTTAQQQFRDADHLLARFDLAPMKDTKVGLFGLYQRARPETAAATPAAGLARPHLLKNYAGVDFDLYNVGVDGTAKFGPAFVNFDAIYQGGKSNTLGAAELDHSAFFAHADVGMNFGPARLTYTGWYATGDDDPTDGDIKNYTATDVDTFDSIIFFEGGYVDDNYFTEAPYFLTAGAIFNRLALDFKATQKTTLSASVAYVMTAEDLVIGTGATADTSKNLGVEIGGAIAHKLNPNLELAVNAGYLIADDGMDAFEANRDGEADRNIFRTTARARYTF